MEIYYFTAGADSEELRQLESSLRSRLPTLRKLVKLDEVTQVAREASAQADLSFIIFPVLAPVTSLDRLISVAEQEHPGIFFVFVSREISASDYKRLVRSGGADWVSLDNAPHEIAEIVGRAGRSTAAPVGSPAAKPVIAAFIPASGGAGNTTLALETAIQLKQAKQTRQQRICLLDLDVQTSHVCDYVDLEARMQLREILGHPERLDDQLFELFVSRHGTGLDVLAAPRGRQDPVELNMQTLDALFGKIAPRYDLVLVDLPLHWSPWTRQILSVCDLVVVTGLNTVAGLRQVSETLAAVKAAEPPPARVVVGLNRCEARLIGGIARSQHVKRILGSETVLTIRDDPATAVHAVNTGIPISVGEGSSKIAKDIRALCSLVAELQPAKR